MTILINLVDPPRCVECTLYLDECKEWDIKLSLNKSSEILQFSVQAGTVAVYRFQYSNQQFKVMCKNR